MQATHSCRPNSSITERLPLNVTFALIADRNRRLQLFTVRSAVLLVFYLFFFTHGHRRQNLQAERNVITRFAIHGQLVKHSLALHAEAQCLFFFSLFRKASIINFDVHRGTKKKVELALHVSKFARDVFLLYSVLYTSSGRVCRLTNAQQPPH